MLHQRITSGLRCSLTETSVFEVKSFNLEAPDDPNPWHECTCGILKMLSHLMVSQLGLQCL